MFGFIVASLVAGTLYLVLWRDSRVQCVKRLDLDSDIDIMHCTDATAFGILSFVAYLIGIILLIKW